MNKRANPASPYPATSTGHRTKNAAAERAHRALVMRRDGHSNADIVAADIGYRNVSSVSRAIARALGDAPDEQTDDLRRVSGMRLEHMFRVTQESMSRDFAKGRSVAVHVNAAVRILERYARMYGLDAPVAVAVTSGTAVDLDAALRDLTAVAEEEARLKALGPPPPPRDSRR